MNIKIYSLATITLLSFFSCAPKDKADEVDESLFSPAPVKSAQAISVADSATQKTMVLPQAVNVPNTGITPPATGTIINANQQINTIQAPAQTNTAGLNPAHGQPGHRCDISVGAPLNSKPVAQNAAPAVNTSPGPVITPVAPATTRATAPTAPGMNPPHGQPGHRCDISVGAPLNSKPAPAAAAATPIMVTPVNANDSAKH